MGSEEEVVRMIDASYESLDVFIIPCNLAASYESLDVFIIPCNLELTKLFAFSNYCSISCFIATIQVSGAVVFLLSPAAAFITGETVGLQSFQRILYT